MLKLGIISLICTLLLMPMQLFAAEQPTWEFGVGLAAASFPDYRGSDQRHEIALPFPYFSLNTKYIEADDGDLRGLLFRSDQLELDISFGGSLALDPEDNELRQGMPKLRSTLEVGPALSLNLTGPNLDEGWKLLLPFRIVAEVKSSSLDTLGWVARPSIEYENNAARDQWDYNFSFALVYADLAYNEYYYSVAPEYATAARPSYKADKGYSGITSSIAVGRTRNDILLSAYVQYDNLNNTNFIDSPLLVTNENWTVGMAVAWIFSTSE